MKLFFSGLGRRSLELDPRLPSGPRYRLMSCHEDYMRLAHEISSALHECGQPHELMYDSGAFTAWSQGKEVNLDDLIQAYDELIEKYEKNAVAVWLISLDKIPGSRGRTATPNEIEEACRVSDQNFEVLKKRYDKRVLPVFHQNESDARLRDIAAMADYICVSPRNDLHESSRLTWSAEVHSKIPGKRTHGLAATGYSMMRLVPWTSVDSATWVLLGSYGAVFKDEQLRALQVSEQSGSLKDRDQHFRTLSRPEQEAFRAVVTAHGFMLEALETDFYERILFNRIMMTETYRMLPPPETIAREVPVQEGLFGL